MGLYLAITYQIIVKYDWWVNYNEFQLMEKVYNL